MTSDEIIDVCRMFGLDWSSPYSSSRGPHMSISCPLAATGAHADPKDSNKGMSVSIAPGDTSLAYCHGAGCNISGSFWWVIGQAVKARGDPSNLVSFFDQVKVRECPDFKGKCARVVRFKTEFKVSVNTKSGRGEDQRGMSEKDLMAFPDLTPIAESYLKKRGVTDEDIDQWEICWDPKKKRIVFPVRDRRGELAGLSGRALSSKALAKYLCYDGLEKVKFLFGEQFLVEGCVIVIVEGQLDAIIGSQAWKGLELSGAPVRFVAPLGSGFSEVQVETIKAMKPRRVIIFPDGDEAGEIFASKVFALIKRLVPRLAQPAGFKIDPGDMRNEEIVEAVSASKTILKFPELHCLKRI